MTLKSVRAWTMAVSAALAASVWAEPAPPPALPEATRLLTAMYPGVQVAWDQGRITHLYGAPMTWGGTPDAAAAQWLQMHSAAFGAGPLTLRSLWSTPVKNGRFTAYGYEQFIDGMPVEYGGVQVLVLNGPVPRVVYAAGHPAAKPAAGWADAAMTGAEAVAMVRAMPLFRHLTRWTTPMAVVWQGEGTWTAATRAWKFMGEVPKPNDSTDQRFTFFVDVAAGTLLFARNEVLNTDVNGTVKGMGTPGTNPDIAINPPVALPMPEIRMSIAGGSSAFSDRDGNFTIPNAGTTAVNVSSNLSSGRWVNVNPTGVPELTVGPTSVVPPGPQAFMFNPVPGSVNSQTTAQVNAFIHATLSHNYYKDRAPGFAALDIVIPANTGVAGACNAFYNASTINFFNAGSSGGMSCNNTSYSSVIAHEYGHFVVAVRGNLAQGAFGEGLGDVTGMLMYDDPIIGRNFTTTGGIVRDPIGANIQYPCSSSCFGEIHCCGQILGGVWWRIRTNMGAILGSGPGLDETRDLQVAWTMITAGGPNTSNPAGPATAIEVLTVDDNDGNLANGTPHFPSICAAFAAHSIGCPTLQLVTFQYPSGRPQLLVPNQATGIRVDVVPFNGIPTPNSGTVSYSVNGGTFVAAPMAVVGTNQYEATLPAFACESVVRYYFGVGTNGGPVVNDPPGAPASAFSAPSATGVTVALDDNFEILSGWSGFTTGDNATGGRWNRMDPQPTPAQPGDDVTPAPGVNCWVTDGFAGVSPGDRDVDGGKTTLTSPLLNLSAQPNARVSYWRWYSNNYSGPIDDVFTASVSNNDGASWTTVETVGPTGVQAGGGWFQHSFRVADFVPPTASFRIRFVASDFGASSNVEAAVDDVLVRTLHCSASCYADCNQDGALTVADFGCFQTKFTIADPYADCNGDAVLTVADFGCFQTKFVAGCP